MANVLKSNPSKKVNPFYVSPEKTLNVLAKKEVGVAISGGIQKGSGELFPLLS
jgi:hypothetical protein